MPKRFFFWDALPKSGYGKIPKRLVRDELEARGLLDLNKAFSSEVGTGSREENASSKMNPTGT
jgi:fatty-acyl-CoA synthase